MDLRFSLSISFICMLFNAADISIPEVSSDRGFSVISFNIGNAAEAFPSPEEVWRTVDEYIPDILLLQEVVSRENVLHIVRLMEEEYDSRIYWNFTSSIGNGVAIVSRYPLDNFTVIPGSQTYGGAAAFAQIGGKRVLLSSIHLPYIPKERDAAGNVDLSPVSLARTLGREFLFETSRSQQIAPIHAWMQEQSRDAAVAAGDFNTVPFSRVQTVMQEGFSDSLYGKRDYLASSYKKIAVSIGTRADFIFHSTELVSSESFIIQSTPGDHYPVFAKFSWVQD